jgi:hypothetical protein
MRFDREAGHQIALGVAEVLMARSAVKAATIGGSIRRGKSEVKDAEIIVEPTADFCYVTDRLLAAGTWRKAEYTTGNRWGEKYRGLEVNGMKVELFCATPENWGYILWLRTGPGEANMLAMKHMAAKTGIRAIGGYIWGADDWYAVRKTGNKIEWRSETKQRLNVAMEIDMFALLGIRMLPPGERDEVAYHGLFKDAKPADWRAYVDQVEAQPRQMGLW